MFEKIKKVLNSLKLHAEGKEGESVPRKNIQEAVNLLKEIERDVLEKELSIALDSLERMDDNRRFFFLLGKLYVEVSREEAKELIRRELQALKQWR